MYLEIILFLSISVVFCEKACYFNAKCPYLLHSTKTPYDTVRGDIRDYAEPENCEAVTIWSLHRHGNRNPGDGATDGMKEMSLLKDEIIASFESGTSQLCAQDIDLFRQWTWDENLEVSQSFLTETGYHELYNIGSRIRQKYSHLLDGDENDFYLRPTNVQRTIVSSAAFLNGLTAGTGLNLTVDVPREIDNVIRPYENCDRYQQEVKSSQMLEDQIEAYYNSPEFIAVQNAVQQRLGISRLLSAEDVYSLYELCRFPRSWSEKLQSPWCSVFTNEDLLVLEYYDDVRHFYRNGYGSWVNVHLGAPPLRDLYETMEASVQGQGKKIVSYFSHDTMMEMTFCALGLYKDDSPLVGDRLSPNRLWRTSEIGAFCSNMIVVLNRCEDSDVQSYRVQIFVNEKETPLCPMKGCSWDRFQAYVQPFIYSSLDFCDMSFNVSSLTDSAVTISGMFALLVLIQVVLLY